MYLTTTTTTPHPISSPPKMIKKRSCIRQAGGYSRRMQALACPGPQGGAEVKHSPGLLSAAGATALVAAGGISNRHKERWGCQIQGLCYYRRAPKGSLGRAPIINFWLGFTYQIILQLPDYSLLDIYRYPGNKKGKPIISLP